MMITAFLAIRAANTLFKNGRVFMVLIFNRKIELAVSTNNFYRQASAWSNPAWQSIPFRFLPPPATARNCGKV
jgi:hypothetical protein